MKSAMKSAGKRSERQKHLSDVGIRLKVDEPNLLENYSKHMRTKRREKKKKKKQKQKKQKKTKKASKTVVVESGRDPLLNILNETENKKKKKDITIEEIPEDVPVPSGPSLEEEEEDPFIQEIKKVKVQRKPIDLSEKDPENVKTMTITASLKLDKKKTGSNIRLE